MELTTKRMITWLAQLTCTSLLLFYALSRVRHNEIAGIVVNSNVPMLFLVIITTILGLLIVSYRLKRLLFLYDIKAGFWSIMKLKLEASFFTLFSPLVGDFYKIHVIRSSWQSSYQKNALIVLLERMIFVLSLTILVVPFWFLGYVKIGTLLKIIIICMLLLEITILYLSNKPHLLTFLLNRLRIKTLTGDNTHREVKRRDNFSREMIVNTGIAALRHGTGVLTYYIVAFSLVPHFSAGLLSFSGVVLSVILINLLPISVGGIGLRESIAVVLFPQIGVSPDFAFSISIIISSTVLLMGVAGGISFGGRKIFAVLTD